MAGTPSRPPAAARRRAAFSAVALACLVLAAPLQAQDKRALVFDWVQGALVDDQGDPIEKLDKVTPETSITVRVKNFNYFRFMPKMQVEEEVLEAYQFLDNLWQGLLGFDLSVLGELMGVRGTAGILATDDFEGRYNELRYTMFRLGTLMSGRIAEHRRPALPWSDELARFTVFVGEFPIACDMIDDATCAVGFDDLVNYMAEKKFELDRFVAENRDDSDAISHTELTRYFKLVPEHNEFLSTVASFESTLEFIRDGKPFVIGTKDAGTRVTVTFVPQTTGGATVGGAESFGYFVESTLPAVFSFGYMLSGLADVTVEKVRLDGSDVFQLQSDENTSHDLAAFLSLRPRWAWLNDDGSAAVMLSLGTSLSDPGAKLMAGPSVLFRGWILTVGAATGKVQTAFDPVDPDDAQSVANLFRSVAETREWEFFFSLSFNPF